MIGDQQMKTTYLVNQEQPDGSVCLAVVSSTVWRTIVERNKQLPLDQQRYFSIDYIKDGDELDRMVIEAPADAYRTWHREHMAAERNRVAGNMFQHLSIDALLFDNDEINCLLDALLTENQAENIVLDRMLMADLRKELAAWKPWANNLLDLYLQGERRTCTNAFAEKCGVSPQVIRKYKRQFENFIKNFLSDVSL